jgi:hypothetical protein
MGGPGSTRWKDYPKRKLVEDCLVLDLSQLNRAGLFDRETAYGALRWSEPRTGEVLASAVFGMKPLDDGERALAIGYERTQGRSTEKIVELLRLESTRPHFGGLRWFARCPDCDGRGYKLYLPPGATRYRCRGCHDLTYLSVQDHDKRVDRLRRNPAARAAVLDGGIHSAADFRRLDLAMKALPRWAQPFPKRRWPGPSDAWLRVEFSSAEDLAA